MSEVPSAALTLWRELTGRPDAFAPGSRVVVRGARGLAPPGWTGIVRLGDAVAIDAGDAPGHAIDTLAALDDPTDPGSVVAALAPRDTLGPGELAYLPDAARPPIVPERAGLTFVERSVGELRTWLDGLPERDVAESSVGDMNDVVVAHRDGVPLAAAGHLDWPTDVAHMGVLVAPPARRRGVGLAVAAAAVERALRRGASPQWRAARDNTASRALATSLGFVEVGRQFSVLLAPEADG